MKAFLVGSPQITFQLLLSRTTLELPGFSQLFQLSSPCSPHSFLQDPHFFARHSQGTRRAPPKRTTLFAIPLSAFPCTISYNNGSRGRKGHNPFIPPSTLRCASTMALVCEYILPSPHTLLVSIRARLVPCECHQIDLVPPNLQVSVVAVGNSIQSYSTTKFTRRVYETGAAEGTRKANGAPYSRLSHATRRISRS